MRCIGISGGEGFRRREGYLWLYTGYMGVGVGPLCNIGYYGYIGGILGHMGAGLGSPIKPKTYQNNIFVGKVTFAVDTL